MSQNTQLNRAKKLIEAKRYEDAKALLVTIDHPIADKWLSRLNTITANTQHSAPIDYTNRVVALIVLYFILFIPGLIAGVIWSRQARADLRKYGEVPGAKLIININRFVFIIFVIVLMLSLLLLIISLIQFGGPGESFIYTLF